MIEIRLKQTLKKRERSLYWLAKETQTHYPNLWKLAEGDVTRISIQTLDAVCEALECQPGDLLVRVERRKARKK